MRSRWVGSVEQKKEPLTRGEAPRMRGGIFTLPPAMAKRMSSDVRLGVGDFVQNASILMKRRISEAWCETRRFL